MVKKKKRKIKKHKKVSAKQKRPKRKLLHRDMTFSEKIVGLIFLVCLIVTTYLVLPISRVSQVEVVGVKDLDATQVAQVSGVIPNQLVLSAWLDSQGIEERIKKTYYRASDVSVQVTGNNAIQLHVSEHESIAYVDLGAVYYTVLSNGVVLEEKLDKYIGTIPIVTWEGDIETLEIMARELAKIPENMRQAISEITYKPEDRLVMTIYLFDGNKIVTNYTDFSRKLAYYPSMKTTIGDKKGTIDLTVGAYFVPYAE